MKQIEYIQDLISHGRWTFTTSEIAERIDKDFYGKIYQLRQAGRVINPALGFYVIVPEEYMGTDRLPVERYIHAMMDHLSLGYYVGLLTAAFFYWIISSKPTKVSGHGLKEEKKYNSKSKSDYFLSKEDGEQYSNYPA